MCLELWRIYLEKIWKGEEFAWKCEGFIKKNEKIWNNDEYDWTSERICMAKKRKSEEVVWKREGFIKKSEEFLWKNDEFVWKSERIYMAQRYSKYRFFDVNCILSILFQVQFWGCQGKPKFQFHILCGWRTLYILSYITVFT